MARGGGGGGGEKKEEVVAVAIDKDKSSQYALKWTVDHLITRGQTVVLLHIKNRASSVPNPCNYFNQEYHLLSLSLSLPSISHACIFSLS